MCSTRSKQLAKPKLSCSTNLFMLESKGDGPSKKYATESKEAPIAIIGKLSLIY